MSSTPNPNARREHLGAALALWLGGGERAEQGARDVFHMLWPVYVRRYQRGGLTEAEAEDLASEALFKILRGAHTMYQAAAFEKWANTIARNTLLTYLRDGQQEKLHEVSLDDVQWQALAAIAPDTTLGDPLTQLCLQQQLDKFCCEHAMRAELLKGCVLQGWSMEQAAQALGRTLLATKEYLSQCRKHLMRYLQTCLEN